jgi:hypothetical protein
MLRVTKHFFTVTTLPSFSCRASARWTLTDGKNQRNNVPVLKHVACQQPGTSLLASVQRARPDADRSTLPALWPNREFANEHFRRGHKDQLRDIHRRKPATQGQPNGVHVLTPSGQAAPTPAAPSTALVAAGSVAPAIELGAYGGFREEVDNLKRDKNVLMVGGGARRGPVRARALAKFGSPRSLARPYL